jgi:hypothetical protein
MKKLLPVFALFAFSAMAADFTGNIVDKKCSGNKGMLSNSACVKKCADGGEALVLVTEDGKVLQVSDQAKVAPHGGHKVTISGKLEGDKIVDITGVKM